MSSSLSLLTRPRPGNAILPGTLGHLPLALQYRLRETVETGALGPADLDPRLVQDLCEMPEEAGIVCVERFLSSNLLNIRNKSGFMVGVLNRFREEGGPASIAPSSPFPGGTATTTTTPTVPPQPQAGVPQEERTVHLSNLGPGVTADLLRQIFSCIGAVLAVRLVGASDGMPPRGDAEKQPFAFVEFAEKAACEMALQMNGTEVAGTSMRVARATPLARPPTVQGLAPGQLAALANVTSPAAMAALQKQAAKTSQPLQKDDVDPFLNPAQQRRAVEERHQRGARQNTEQAWGMSRRRSESSSDSFGDDDDYHRRRRGRPRRSSPSPPARRPPSPRRHRSSNLLDDRYRRHYEEYDRRGAHDDYDRRRDHRGGGGSHHHRHHHRRRYYDDDDDKHDDKDADRRGPGRRYYRYDDTLGAGDYRGGDDYYDRPSRRRPVSDDNAPPAAAEDTTTASSKKVVRRGAVVSSDSASRRYYSN